MSNLTATAAWDNVYQLETSDPVIGGPGGMDNRQAQALINRTEFLKDNNGVEIRYKDKAVITTNTTIDASYIGKVIQIIATDNLTITIDQQRNFDPHSCLKFRVVCVPNKCVKILPSAGEQIDFGGDQENELYLLDGEFLNLVTNSTLSGSTENGRFILDGCSDALFTVGEEIKAKAVIKNTYKQAGQEVNRADFARIWKWISRNCTDGLQLVNDSVWFGSQNVTRNGLIVSVYPYRGCFSKGDGTTTFRFPDDRGMFERVYDDGRGIDSSRIWDAPGGFELDQNLSHDHNIPGAQGRWGLSPDGDIHARGVRNSDFKTDAAGGVENIVKNIAKYSLIRL